MRNKIIRLLVVILCAVICATTLIGCSTPIHVDARPGGAGFNANNNFERVAAYTERIQVTNNTYEDFTYTYFRETNTDVMYVFIKQEYARYNGTTGCTVMMAPDGTPLLYSEWLEIKK